MRDYKTGKTDAGTIIKGVEALFKNKKYLVEGFSNFLPRHIINGERSVFDRIPMERLQNVDRVAVERGILLERAAQERNQERAAHNERNLERGISLERGPYARLPLERMPHERPIMPHDRMRMERMAQERRIPMDRPMMERQSVEQPPFDRSFYPDRRFQFQPRQANQAEIEETHKQKKALGFVHRVKARLNDRPEAYKTFIEILQIYQKSPTNPDKILLQLKNLLIGNDDLLEEFVEFIPQVKTKFHEKEKKEEKPKQESRHECSEMFKTIQEILKQKNLLDSFLKLLNMYNQESIKAKDFIFLLTPIIKDSELIDAFKNFISYKDNDLPPHVLKNTKHYKKINSYRILPEKFREVECDGQDSIAKSVLNSVCISCPTLNSEESTFVSSKKNICEEILYKVEDERYECELNVTRINDLIICLEMLSKKIIGKIKEDDKNEDAGEKESNSNIDDSVQFAMEDIDMSAGIVQEILNYIYGEKGFDILEGILTKPSVSISIVLRRLYTISRKLRKDMLIKGKVWRETVNKYFYKALDAQGFVYKSNEKKENINRDLQKRENYVIDDFAIIDDIKNVFEIYLDELHVVEGKEIFDFCINFLKGNDKTIFNIPSFAVLVKHILNLYEKLFEIKNYFIKQNNERNIKKIIKSNDALKDENLNVVIKNDALKDENIIGQIKTDENILNQDIIYEENSAKKRKINDNIENKEFSNFNEPKKFFVINEDEKLKKDIINENLSNKDSLKDFNSLQKINSVSKKLNFVSEEEIYKNDPENCNYETVIKLIKENLTGYIDNFAYEDKLRLISNLNGYKLNKIEKIMMKIESLCIDVLNDDLSQIFFDLADKNMNKIMALTLAKNEDVYCIRKEKNTISIYEDIEERDEYAIQMVRMDEDESLETKKVYLERKSKGSFSDVFINFNLECCVGDNLKLKFIEGTEDFVIKRNKERNCEFIKNNVNKDEKK
ncbi:hypothetical protein GVAV_001371 [Gurleya vavrai]